MGLDILDSQTIAGCALVLFFGILNVLAVAFLHKKVISVKTVAAVSLITQQLMVEESSHCQIAVSTLVGISLLLMTRLVLVVEESMRSPIAM